MTQIDIGHSRTKLCDIAVSVSRKCRLRITDAVKRDPSILPIRKADSPEMQSALVRKIVRGMPGSEPVDPIIRTFDYWVQPKHFPYNS